MTAEFRQALKAAVDAAVRARLPEYDAACAGCGAPHVDPWTEEPHYTDRCRTCTDRRLRRASRERQRAAQLVHPIHGGLDVEPAPSLF